LGTCAPTLYWLRDDPTYPDAALVASEPLFAGNWNSVPPSSIITVEKNLDVHIEQLV
ncbi:MAG: class II glutamine amidotransferase, partial [Coleofasciculus sp. S288]|nr:class II glutamine amidotransferase [Coleofasciculus sp. S288]